MEKFPRLARVFPAKSFTQEPTVIETQSSADMTELGVNVATSPSAFNVIVPGMSFGRGVGGEAVTQLFVCQTAMFLIPPPEEQSVADRLAN